MMRMRQMPVNEIEKIKYSISCFDVSKMAIGRKEIYEIYPDGRVVVRCCQAGSRKYVKKKETTAASETDFLLLCEKLRDCISTADRVNQYIDDTSAELKIYYSFGRVDTMPRGCGNARKDVGSIVREYLLHTAHVCPEYTL